MFRRTNTTRWQDTQPDLDWVGKENGFRKTLGTLCFKGNSLPFPLSRVRAVAKQSPRHGTGGNVPGAGAVPVARAGQGELRCPFPQEGSYPGNAQPSGAGTN